jgi:hypothetical protein
VTALVLGLSVRTIPDRGSAPTAGVSPRKASREDARRRTPMRVPGGRGCHCRSCAVSPEVAGRARGERVGPGFFTCVDRAGIRRPRVRGEMFHVAAGPKREGQGLARMTPEAPDLRFHCRADRIWTCDPLFTTPHVVRNPSMQVTGTDSGADLRVDSVGHPYSSSQFSASLSIM